MNQDLLKDKFKNSLNNSGLDTVFLSKAYEIEDLDRVEIYDILTKIYINNYVWKYFWNNI